MYVRNLVTKDQLGVMVRDGIVLVGSEPDVKEYSVLLQRDTRLNL